MEAILIGLGSVLAVILAIFIKVKASKPSLINTTKREEKAILKTLKKAKKEEAKITKEYEKTKQKTSQAYDSVTRTHDERKNDLHDLFSKGGGI